MAERLLHPMPEAIWSSGLGRSKFYELIAAGEIEVVKVGRRTLVPDASLRAFVERLRRGEVHASSPAASSPSVA